MAINKKLIHFLKKADFDTLLSAGNILDTSIVFIKDAKQIFTHGQLYPCPFTEDEIRNLLSTKADLSKLNNYLTKADASATYLPKGDYITSIPTANGTTAGIVKQGGDVTISNGVITVNDDSHNHIISNVDGLQSALDAKQDIISDLSTIRSGASKGATALQSVPVATSTSLGGVKSGGDVTISSEGIMSVVDDSHNHIISNVDGLLSALDAKLGIISDLSTIRSGAALGATALQSVPTATTSTAGIVKVGSNISVSSGTISLSKNNVTAALGYTPPTAYTNMTASEATTGTATTGRVISAKVLHDKINEMLPTTLLEAKSYTDTKVSELVGLAPDALNTIYELAEAMATNLGAVNTLESAIGNKVDKVTGKGLSTNDYTTNEKNKLAGIASGAEVNVQSDWSVTDTTSDAYIKNKPSLSAVATSGKYSDLSGRPSVDDAVSTSSTNAVQNKAITAAVNAKYTKPSTGIPSTDLSSDVLESLAKADSALQSFIETDPVFTASAAASIKSSDISNWNSKTSNVGTITGIKMNGASKGTSGVVDLGTVITAHQDISGKVDKVSGKGLSTNDYTDAEKSKLAGIAAGANKYSLPLAASGTRGGIQLGYSASGANVPVAVSSEKAYVALTKTAVTSALGYTPPTSNTTYSIATNGTSGLVKPWYNHTTASTGPTAGSDSTAVTVNSISTTSGRYYALEMDSNGRGFVNVPWSNTTYTSLKNPNSLTVQYNGTTAYSYDGSAAKTLNIKAGSNITVSGDSSGNITINGTPNTTYAAGKGLTLSSTTFNVGAGTGISVGDDTISVKYGTAAGTAAQGNDSRLSDTRNPKINILSAEDLNNITTPGFYEGGGSNTVTNKPSGIDAFGLIVFKTAGSYITQELTEGNTNAGCRWTRQYTGSWSSWIPMPTFSATPTSGQVVVTEGTTGKVKSSGYTIAKSVPSNAVFTDTKVTSVGNHYTPASDDSAKLTASASSSTAATWGSTDMVTGVTLTRDAKGHVTGLSVSSIQMPANPNSDTHYTTGINAGASGATSNSAVTNPYITVKDNSTYRSQIQLKGGGKTTVTSDSSGVVTINSTWRGITDSTSTTDSTTSASATAVKAAYDKAVSAYNLANGKTSNTGTVTKVSTGKGLTGGTITTTGTIKCNLNSETSLGTIGSTSKLYAVGVDANNKLCVNVPWTDNNTTYSAATTSAAGLMSASDKSKLDGIQSGADAVSFSRSLTSGTKIGTITINGTGTDLYCQTNTNTTYSAGNGLTLSSTTFNVGAGTGISVAADTVSVSSAVYSTASATTAATAGWYRIATTAASISNCSGIFQIVGAVSGKHTTAIITAGTSYGIANSSNISVLQCSHYSANAISKVRIVYHTTYNDKYAYLEVYNPNATALSITVKMLGGTGWSLVTPSTAGSVPSGYSNKEATLSDATIYSEKFSGNGSGLSSLNASNISSGTIGAARLPAATTSAQGAMTAAMVTKLNGIATGATKVTTDTVSGWGYTKNTGTVTSVKVGSTSYSPSSGVVSLPAYPTTLPASDVSSWAKAASKPTYTYSEVGAAAASHTQAYSTLTGSGTTANQAIVSSGTANGWTLKTLGSNAFNSTTIPTNTNQLTNGAGFITGITKNMVTNALGYTPPTTNTTYSLVGANGTTGLIKNGSTVTSTSGLTACPIISGVPYYKDTNTTYTLSSLGIGNVKNYDQSKAIKSITRSGTTFTYTCLDGSTGTFNQQDNNTTYSVATASANGLMAAADKSLSNFLQSYGTATTLASLDVSKSVIYATLSAATSISLSAALAVGRSITVICAPSTSFTQPIPTSGNFISMDGDSLEVTSGKNFEINILCYATGKYSISCKTAK